MDPYIKDILGFVPSTLNPLYFKDDPPIAFCSSQPHINMKSRVDVSMAGKQSIHSSIGGSHLYRGSISLPFGLLDDVGCFSVGE